MAEIVFRNYTPASWDINNSDNRNDYPLIYLKLTVTETKRTASNVTLSIRVYMDINGWSAQRNYGGYLHIGIGSTSYLDITYIKPEGGGVTSPWGQMTKLYDQTHSITVPASSSATSVTLNVWSTSGNSSWTSFIWNVPTSNTKIPISAGTIAVTSVTVNPTTLNLQTNGTNTGKISATVNPSNATNKTVSWSSSNGNIATVSGGTVTAKANGQCTITASCGGKSASTTVNVTTKVTGVSLSTNSISLINAGSSTGITATVSPSNASNRNVTWSTSNSAVASYYDGKIIAAGNGTCTITVKTDDGGYTASCNVTVSTAATGIYVDKQEIWLTTNGDNKSTYVTATVTPENASNKNVSWSTNNGNVASVNAGTITAKGNGDCTITATNSAGHNAYVTVHVSTNITSLYLNKTSLNFRIEGNTKPSEKLVATTNSGASIRESYWTSSNSGVATVDSNGNVQSISNGTCTIEVTKIDVNGNMKKASCTVTVTTGVTSVSVNPTSVTITCNTSNNTRQLSASIYPTTASNKSVTWTTSDSSIATVNSSGLVTANSNKKNGSCTITVKTVDGGKTATCSVKVIVGVERVTLSASYMELIVSNEAPNLRYGTLTATVEPANAENKNILWYTTDSNIAGVSNGNITAKNGGTCTITVETVDGGKTANCNILSIYDKGPSGELLKESDTTWNNEQCVRVNHQEKYGITIDGVYQENIIYNNVEIDKVEVAGTKVWFRTSPYNSEMDNQISCNSFSKPGDKQSNSSGACAEIGHCAEIINTNINPFSPTKISMNYIYATLINATNKTAKIKLFGLNTNGYWVELKVSNNQITSTGITNSITINCDSKNFFTQFRIGIFPDSDNFITTCSLSNIKIIDYKKDASLDY